MQNRENNLHIKRGKNELKEKGQAKVKASANLEYNSKILII